MNVLAEKLPKSIDLHKLNNWLPTAVTVLLIIASSYTLAQLTWLIIPAEQSLAPPPAQQSGTTAAMQTGEEQKKIQQITEAHLFGKYQASPGAAAQTDAPETRLNLTLKGVLAGTPMAGASAIIAMGKNGPEDIYGIGDRVSSATVKEIHPDRVIIERSGRYETLRLPEEFSSNTLIESAEDNGINQGMDSASTPGEVLANIRQEILQNPTSFGQYAIPIPYNENGRLRGYKLQPQGDRALFDQVGLQPDDVIIAINGLELNDPAQGLKALRKLQSAKQIDLKVLRNGTEIPLHFEMP
jgi:general secretion pathway protein C